MQRAPSGSPLNRWRQCSPCSFLVSTMPKHLLSSVLHAFSALPHTALAHTVAGASTAVAQRQDGMDSMPAEPVQFILLDHVDNPTIKVPHCQIVGEPGSLLQFGGHKTLRQLGEVLMSAAVPDKPVASLAGHARVASRTCTSPGRCWRRCARQAGGG